MNAYELARTRYAARGIDTEAALNRLSTVPLSLHCWQGDDVTGFDSREALSGGIQATGSYPGKATTPEELMSDLDTVLSLVPGPKKLNLHASYALFEPGEHADRNALKPCHFERWVRFAKERGLGLDFNPTFFSHPMVKNGLTLSSPEEEVRRFWIDHGKCCLTVAEYFAEQTGTPCTLNFWIPDGYKDIPADRLGPRRRFQESMDEILSQPYDRNKVIVTLESKVFGIGVESYTVGSSEFCLNYAATRGVTPLLDNGHYHPTESVADKLSSLLLFFDRAALHVTRPVRWDSDHVVLFDDEVREIMKELVCHDALERVSIATDYFDASINRIAAWAVGARSVREALLHALLLPHGDYKQRQDTDDFTALMLEREEDKLLPFGAVWEEYLRREKVPVSLTEAVRTHDVRIRRERA